MSVELKLVQEIEKYECLYNHKLPEYSRKEVTDKAWTEVAKITKISVTDCKEKWRNIRSSLVRSIKSGASKSRKPYYLAENLQFLLPYIKPVNYSYVEIPNNICQDDDMMPNEDFVAGETYNKNTRSLQSEIADIQAPKGQTSESKLTPQVSYSVCPNCHNRRSYCEDDKNGIDSYLRNTNKKQRTGNRDNKIDAMWHFMLSLCPEFETMTEAQLRTVKIKTLMLIDEIKSNANQNPVIPTSKSTEEYLDESQPLDFSETLQSESNEKLLSHSSDEFLNEASRPYNLENEISNTLKTI